MQTRPRADGDQNFDFARLYGLLCLLKTLHKAWNAREVFAGKESSAYYALYLLLASKADTHVRQLLDLLESSNNFVPQHVQPAFHTGNMGSICGVDLRAVMVWISSEHDFHFKSLSELIKTRQTENVKTDGASLEKLLHNHMCELVHSYLSVSLTLLQHTSCKPCDHTCSIFEALAYLLTPA